MIAVQQMIGTYCTLSPLVARFDFGWPRERTNLVAFAR